MTPAEAAALLAASRREQALYGELLTIYRGLAVALAGGRPAPDPAWLADRTAAAEAVTSALRALAGTLASRRLTGAPVPEDVRLAWRTSAALAAEAGQLNAAITRLALERQAEITARLVALGAGRRALGAYRPAAAGASAGALA